MFQPFEKFNQANVNGLIRLKKFWLVSQTYQRGFDPFEDSDRIPILLSDYEDVGLARIHYNAVKSDKYAAIVQLQRQDHMNKLFEMLSSSSQYDLFWSIVKDAKTTEKVMNSKYASHIRRFILKNSNWNIGAEETIIPKLEVTFGELFIILKRGSQRIRVKFEEIEKA